MAKNLKFNIKNAQLAEALKLGQVKKPVPSVKKEIKKEAEATTIPQETPIDARFESPDKVQTPTVPLHTADVSPVKQESTQEALPEKKKIELTIDKAAPQTEKKGDWSSSQPISNNPSSVPAKETPRRIDLPPRTLSSGGGQSGHHTGYQGNRSGSGHYSSSGPSRGGFNHAPQRPFESSSTSRPSYPSQRPFSSSAPLEPGQDRGAGGGRPPYAPRPPFARPNGAQPPRTGFAPRPPFARPDSSRPPLQPRDALRPNPAPRSLGAPEAPRKPPVKDFRDVKPAKKSLHEEKTFDSRDRQGLRDTDNEGWRKKRSFKPRHIIQEEVIRPKELQIRLPITVKDLAAEMKLKASQLISKLFMQGVVITLNDLLDDPTVVGLLGHEFDCNITIDTSEEERIRITGKTIRQEIQETDPTLLKIRPPIVAFMGHVDHGKTSLIDVIRKSNRVAGEAGAITQHIGAFCCHTAVGDITVLDTPGHEAFASMRERGADVTDIVVLVVAGDEGLKAQTLEAIEQARSASVPIVVALNKSDKPGFNAEDVYRQLAEKELLPEAWGGTTITINCSATTGAGVKELLEMLALQAEILELKANPSARARGAVIESQMHKGLGAQATILVQNGSLHLGDALVFDQHWGRVKTMHDEFGKELSVAPPSTPVKITGLSGLPDAGSEFIVVTSEKEAKGLGEARTLGQKHLLLQQVKKVGVEGLLQQKAEGIQRKMLNLILRADVQGSLEALKTSLLKIESKKVELNVISSAVGEISESDIQLAAASKAMIIGFHTKIENHADSLIKELKVIVRLHNIIYHAVDDIKVQMVALLDKIPEEVDTGEALVKATFKASQLGIIAGCLVTKGLIRRNQQVRLLRSGKVVWKGTMDSLKRVKEDVREVAKGVECGILLHNYSDIQPDDVIQSFDINYLTQEL